MPVRRILLLLLLLAGCTGLPTLPPRAASVRITAADTLAAMESVTRSAEAMGGYVAEARVWREGDRVRATLVLRVPPRQLTSAMATVRRAATRVESESIRTRDTNGG
jgi:glycine cleavage system regulatory protein